MIHWDDRGPQSWNGVHVTHRTTVAELIDVDNVGPQGTLLAGFDMFRNAGECLDEVIQKGPRGGQADPSDRLGLGAVQDQHHRRLAGEHQASERLLRHRRPVLRSRLSGRGPPVRRARPGRHADRRAQRLSRAGPAGRRQEAGAEGGRDRQRPDHRRRGLREHSRLADQLRGDARLRRRPAHRHRQRPDAVDREGVEARAQPGLRREDRRRADPRRRHLQRGRGQLRHVRDHRRGGGGNGAGLPARLPGDRRHPPRRPEGEAQRGSATPIRRTSTTTSSSSIPIRRKQMAMEAGAPRVPFEPGHPTPKPRWIVRDKNGYAPGINILRVLGGVLRLLPPRFTTGIQFKQYRKLALLDGVRGTPGQLYTSSIYYLEGYIESAFGVSVRDAPETIDICSEVAREMRLPSISQVRLVHRSRSHIGLHPARAEDGGLRGRPHQRRHVPRIRAAAGRGVPEGGDPLHDALVEELGDRPAASSTTCTAPRRSRAGRRRGGRLRAATRR